MITHIVNESDNTQSVFYYIPNFLQKEEEKKLFKYLEETNDFMPNIKYNDGISRLQKWHQIDNKYFCPIWKERYPHWSSFEIDETVSGLINKMQGFVSSIPHINVPNINSCLINKYPSGENFIALHRDSILSFGENPTIVGLSLGQTRNINFIRNDKDISKNFSFTLESGSVFIMAGSSQRFYQHTIPKEFCDNVRYSLTFREFIL